MSVNFDPADAGNVSVILQFLVDKLGAANQAELQELLSNPGSQLAADSYLRSLPSSQRDNLMALDAKVRRQTINSILKSRKQTAGIAMDEGPRPSFEERFPNAGRFS